MPRYAVDRVAALVRGGQSSRGDAALSSIFPKIVVAGVPWSVVFFPALPQRHERREKGEIGSDCDWL